MKPVPVVLPGIVWFKNVGMRLVFVESKKDGQTKSIKKEWTSGKGLRERGRCRSDLGNRTAKVPRVPRAYESEKGPSGHD